jgi:DNA replication protein DnaC
MNPMPEIAPMLKQLRLSSILDSLESRNRQAIENKLSYMDFLATLIIDEIARRNQKRFASALRRANFRNQKTLEEFDFTFNPNINRAQITDLASCRFIEEKVSVLIVGPCGTGKSHIAQALGHCAIRAGYDVLFTTVSKMLAQMNAARANNGFDRHFAKLAAVDLLIIDDFGLRPLQGSQDEDFHEVIAERYERRSTIVTSNLDIPEWTEAFPNRILGAATIDRLRHGAYKIVLDGKTYRSTQPAPKAQNATHEKPEKTTGKTLLKGGEKP